MLSHNQTKFINSLKIKKFRQIHQAFIVEGEKGVDELLKSSLQTQQIFATPAWFANNTSLLSGKNISLQEITTVELKKVTDLVTPNQVLAIAVIPVTTLPGPSKLTAMTLALDGIRDPGNMGTMIRTADWFGISNIICSSDCVDIYNPKVVQATMGSFSRVNVFYTDLLNYFRELPSEIPVFGALLKGPDITEKKFTSQGIILIGSESHGISESLIPYINEPLHIPRFSKSETLNSAESLNASIANGIICYEICKQLFKNIF
jgi:TrmH family RNA methyltransferase